MKTTAMLAAFVLVVAAVPASADTHFVDVAGGADFESIGAAFAVAVDGDSIVVASGTYPWQNNTNIFWGDRNLVLTKAPGRQNPVIDCGGQGRFIDMRTGFVDSSSVISGLTVFDGYGSLAPYYGGGAISMAEGASPIVEYCDFVECVAQYGGAVQVVDSGPKIRYCLFKDNSVGHGGALWTSGGRAVVHGCAFLDNWSFWEGGAVRCVNADGAYPIIRRCTFARNSAPTGGGIGISNDGAPTILQCIIALSGNGGAISETGTEASEINHCISFGNVGGDTLRVGRPEENLYVDPLFCDPESDDFTVCADSPALPGYNPWGVDIGAYDGECPPCGTPVDDSTWGVIKALYR